MEVEQSQKLSATLQGAWFVLLKYPAYCDSLSLCNGVAEIHGMLDSHMCSLHLHALGLQASLCYSTLCRLCLALNCRASGRRYLSESQQRSHLHGRLRHAECTLVLAATCPVLTLDWRS